MSDTNGVSETREGGSPEIWIDFEEQKPPVGVEVMIFSVLPRSRTKTINTYHNSKYDIGVWKYVTFWRHLPPDPTEEYDYLGDSDPNGDTLCGSLGRMHRWKRYNYDKTLCVHPGCNARC